ALSQRSCLGLVLHGQAIPLARHAFVEFPNVGILGLSGIQLALDASPEVILGFERHRRGDIGEGIRQLPPMVVAAKPAIQQSLCLYSFKQLPLDLDARGDHFLAATEYQMRHGNFTRLWPSDRPAFRRPAGPLS